MLYVILFCCVLFGWGIADALFKMIDYHRDNCAMYGKSNRRKRRPK